MSFTPASWIARWTKSGDAAESMGTATAPPKRAKSAKRLRRFFRGISAAASLHLIRLDFTPEAVAQPSGPPGQPVFAYGSIPYRCALGVPLRNRPLHLSKSSRAE